MAREDIAILISCISLAAAFFSLGWTVYRDVYLKARLRINFMLGILHHETFSKPVWRYSIGVSNLGPGKINLQSIFVQDYSLWKKITRGIRYAHIMYDFKSPLSGRLPYILDVGQRLDLSFDPEDCKFLDEGYSHIGLTDSFGRLHWCRKRDYIEAVKAYREKTWKKET